MGLFSKAAESGTYQLIKPNPPRRTAARTW